jgi:hypothetical protein
MQFEHRNHDDAIDKTLAALKSAAPPTGMEARILQRMQQHAPAAPFRWRDLLTGSALAGAWWRGALSGVVTAMLLVGALLFAQHSLQPRQSVVSQIPATHSASTPVPVAASASNTPSHANPCITPNLLHATRTVRAMHAQTISSARFAPSRPAPVLPLTAQERALVRLVQTVNPKQLASFSFDAQEKAEAQEIDDFNKFFTPPPEPPQPPNNDSPTNTQQPAPQQGEQI